MRRRRPRQAPDVSRTAGESGTDLHRCVGSATVVETFVEQHESDLDESTAERK